MPAVIPVVAAVGGAALSSRGSRKAAKDVRQGTEYAAEQSAEADRLAREDLQPYADIGQQQFGRLNALQNQGLPQANYNNLPDPMAVNLRDDPVLNFMNQESMRAVQDSAAARGKLQSGGTLAAIADRVNANTGARAFDRINQVSQIRNQMFGERFNQQNQALGAQNQQYNQLFNLVGLGANAGAQVGTAGQQTAANIGNLNVAGANARASGYLGLGNAVGGGLNGLAFMGGMNNINNMNTARAGVNDIVNYSGLF